MLCRCMCVGHRVHSRDDEFEDDDSFDELVVGGEVGADTADVLGAVAGFPATPHIHDARYVVRACAWSV